MTPSSRNRCVGPDPNQMSTRLSLADLLCEAVLARGGQRRGDEWVFCCPAHDDDHPSASWNAQKQVWHCFACGAGGGASDLASRLQVLGVTPSSHLTAGRTRSAPAAPLAPHVLPSAAELGGLLRASQPVLPDHAVAAYLRSRAIDPFQVDRRLCLARSLPVGATCPAWAHKSVEMRARPEAWSNCGYRLLIPLFAPGQWQPVSVRARRITAGDPKSVSGRGLTSKNVVMSDSLGRQLLATRSLPHEWPATARLRLVIAEGEIDFLTLATWWPDEHPSPAVWGIVSGSWSHDLAACVPSGTSVELRTDPDPAGERLAEQVNATLGARCEVVRVLPPGPQR